MKYISLFIAANGVGKSLLFDVEILLADGSKKIIKEIKVGDTVMGHNYNTGLAEPSKVIRKYDSGIKNCYKVILKDGIEFTASKEHKFPVKIRSGRNSKVIMKTLEEIAKYEQKYIGGSVKFQQPKLVDFKQGNKLPIDPYLLGVLLGDGCLAKEHSLSFTSKDHEIIDRVKDIIKKDGYVLSSSGNITYRIVGYKKNDKGYGINEIKDELEKLGLWGSKSGNKFIPQIYKTASIENRRQLLAGLIDTDGTFTEYTSKSKRLAEDFCFLVRSLGGKATLKDRIVKTNFTHNEYKKYYRVYWRFDYELPLALQRKQKISKRPIEYSNRFLKSIEFVGPKQCYDIEIDHPSHCFLLESFISTSNSCVGANIVSNIVFGKQPFDHKRSRWEEKWGTPPDSFYDYTLFRDYPYKNKRIRIVSDPTGIKEKIVPELKKWFLSNRKEVHYTTLKEGKNFEAKFKTSTGFTIDLMTYEQSSKEFESVDVDIIWFDEPPPKDIFMASIARLRTGGQILMTLTPLTFSAWIKDELYDKKIEKNIAVVEADVWANCYDHEQTRGILRTVDIEKMIQQYPEEEKLARIEGKFGHILGLVHKINRDVHVIEPLTPNKDDYVVYMAHDTHPRTPDALNWMAVDRKGTKFIVDELVIDGKDAEIAAAIKAKDMLWRRDRNLLDPSGFNKDNRSTEKCFGDRMAALGIYYEKGSKNLDGAIRATNQVLKYEMKNGEMIKPPELYICSNCVHSLRELDNYVWDDYKGRQADEKNPKPHPKDKNDHNVESIHRLVIEDFRWYPKAAVETSQVSDDPFNPIQTF